MVENRLQQIAADAESELDEYLDEVGWEDNPFAHRATMDEYVIPSEEDLADITTHLRDPTGMIIIHSEYSGIGKTMLLDMILRSNHESHTVKMGQHDLTAYEMVGIIADKLGIGRSNSTKFTEQKIEQYLAENDDEVIVGIDEFSLNDPSTIHSVQFLNDLDQTHVILTGMSSQRDAMKEIGSEGAAFMRRTNYETKLEPFDFEQTREMVERRIASVTDHEYHGNGSVPIEPIHKDALKRVHAHGSGVPAVMTSALSTAVTYAAALYADKGWTAIEVPIVEGVDYSDPRADKQEEDN